MELLWFWIAALGVIVLDVMVRTITSKLAVVATCIAAVVINVLEGNLLLAAIWGVSASLNLMSLGRMLP